MRRLLRLAVITLVTLAVLASALAIAGSVRDWHVVTVSRTTDAPRDVLWDLWADVPERTEWDTGLEYIELDGPFAAGSTGTVKVEGQGPIDYSIVEVVPQQRYTDRFESLLGTHTDWHHSIEAGPDGRRAVTWRLEARGPLALVSLPVLKNIFGEEVPDAVDTYVRLAESRSRGRQP